MPEVNDTDGETAWALWEDANSPPVETQPAPHEAPIRRAVPQNYTQPMGLPTERSAYLPAAPTGVNVDALMAVARRLNRACPRIGPWRELHSRLLSAAPSAGDELPPPPRGEGFAPSAVSMRLLLRRQLDWAEAHGVLPVAAVYLRVLSEKDWLHVGEDW